MGLSKVNKGLQSCPAGNFKKEESISPNVKCIDINVEEYQSYISKIVRKFWRKLPKNSRWDISDFESEAWLALIDCARNYYNPEYNDSLKAYAHPFIVKRLSEYMSTNMYTLKTRYYNIRHKPEELARINAIEAHMVSFNREIVNGDGESEEIELKSSKDEPTLVDDICNNEEVAIIKHIVNEELSKNERRAIVRRFRDDESYREIAKHLKISHETARQLVSRGIEKIKQKAKYAGINSP